MGFRNSFYIDREITSTIKNITKNDLKIEFETLTFVLFAMCLTRLLNYFYFYIWTECFPMANKLSNILTT